MLIEVSVGEAVDKLNILELKYKKITNESKRNEIMKEINSLHSCNIYKQKYNYYYNILSYVNEKIWDLTDEVKLMSIDEPLYSSHAYQIFEFNQKRFRIKNFFNLLIQSNIKEQKSYNSTYCKIVIENEETFYKKIPEINYFSIEYDYVILEYKYKPTYAVDKILSSPNIIDGDDTNDINKNVTNININNFILPKQTQSIFQYSTINYLGTGKLGDFVQSLSIINETYLMTGKKGDLYIYDGIYKNTKLERFRCGIEYTYRDTYEIVSNQPYINKFQIFTGERIDINLNEWRCSHLMYKANWHVLLSNYYKVNWGARKWITSPIDIKWKDTVFVNISSYRHSNTIDYNLLHQKYGNSLIFISPNLNEYVEFKKNTNLNIELFMPSTFTELCIAINSCKLLIGGLSAILAIGHALHINRVIALCSDPLDNICNLEFDKIWDNISYNI